MTHRPLIMKLSSGQDVTLVFEGIVETQDDDPRNVTLRYKINIGNAEKTLTSEEILYIKSHIVRQATSVIHAQMRLAKVEIPQTGTLSIGLSFPHVTSTDSSVISATVHLR